MCPEFVSVHVFLLFNAVLLLGQNKFPRTPAIPTTTKDQHRKYHLQVIEISILLR